MIFWNLDFNPLYQTFASAFPDLKCFISANSGGSRILAGGANPGGRGRWDKILLNFPENWMKLRTIWLLGGMFRGVAHWSATRTWVSHLICGSKTPPPLPPKRFFVGLFVNFGKKCGLTCPLENPGSALAWSMPSALWIIICKWQTERIFKIATNSWWILAELSLQKRIISSINWRVILHCSTFQELNSWNRRFTFWEITPKLPRFRCFTSYRRKNLLNLGEC